VSKEKMTKKQEFINFINDVMNESNIGPDHMSENVRLYWEAFCGKDDVEKPLFTDNGKLILKYLQDNTDTPMWKARDIAEGLFISSRAVSGAMRKLVTDGFVEKVGQDPVVYAITEAGKTIEIV
jgi:DNA-binding HxlR family transcriptional regulator